MAKKKLKTVEKNSESKDGNEKKEGTKELILKTKKRRAVRLKM